ncbi:MAG: hypothetical protein HY835_09755, partial [Anaerolineae bacterium]|nr:hypothetical protein [Anaerolineae bacterium]
MQPDTIIPDPYNPLDMDCYAYVRNSPINFTDPTGHSAKGVYLFDGFGDNTGVIPDTSYSWDKEFSKTISPEDRVAAERAYIHFQEDPEYFRDLYLQPDKWESSEEAAYLDLFFQY